MVYLYLNYVHIESYFLLELKDRAEEANRIIYHLFGMCLERGAFKTEWGASPRAQGTVLLLQEISQIRAEEISLHAPETDVRATVKAEGL